MLKTVYSLIDFEVDPAVMRNCCKAIFVDEFIWDDSELDFNILGVVEGCTKVEDSNVEACKFGLSCRDGAV